MKIKLSKSQWKDIGAKANWIKESQAISGKSELGHYIGMYLNSVTDKLLPHNVSKAKGIISQLVSLIDADAKEVEVSAWSQKPR